jgi:hypothetical protein
MIMFFQHLDSRYGHRKVKKQLENSPYPVRYKTASLFPFPSNSLSAMALGIGKKTKSGYCPPTLVECRARWVEMSGVGVGVGAAVVVDHSKPDTEKAGAAMMDGPEEVEKEAAMFADQRQVVAANLGCKVVVATRIAGHKAAAEVTILVVEE